MNDQDFHPSTFDEHILQWHKPLSNFIRNELRSRPPCQPTKPVKPLNIRPQPQQIRPQSNSAGRYPIRPLPNSLGETVAMLKSMVPRNFTFNADIFRAIHCPYCDPRKGSTKNNLKFPPKSLVGML